MDQFELFFSLLSLLGFMMIQGIFINGVHELFKGSVVDTINAGKQYSGNIGYLLAPKWFEKNKGKKWSRPLFSCVRCMSSTYGALTLFPTAIYLYGFQWWEVPVYIVDSISLVYINYWLYKKL